MRNLAARFFKEADFYKRTDKGVQCTICPHNCNLKDGQIGICKSRINNKNILYTTVYGRVCALNIDPIEKKPLFHFYPKEMCLSLATTGCNLRCLNCQNSSISQAAPDEVKARFMSPESLVETAVINDCRNIAYTYTEPFTYYEYSFDTALKAHENRIRNIIVSAGYINEKPLRKMSKYIDAANIDLKSFDNDIYKKLNGATLQPVLNTLKILKEEGVWLEITNLLIPTINDGPDMIKKMCSWLLSNGFEYNPLHFSRFFPIYKLTNLPPTTITLLCRARDIALSEGMKFVYMGNAPEFDGEDTYCPNCKALLIKRRGFHVLENHIKNGSCNKCSTTIPGRF